MGELVIASSSVDAGIGCWDLQTGAEHLRYKSCASPPHGLACVGHRFLASSQLRDAPAASGSILYWSWSKPQVGVKSFPAEPIKPLAANSEGTYVVGGGSSGNIYLWEVATGRLLKKWHAHLRAVTCLVFSDDGSLLISGSEDGGIRVWSLFMIFDDYGMEQAQHPYEHSFTEHVQRVNDLVIGFGGGNAIIVSASVDKTCKVWSLSEGRFLRNIVFPSAIDAIALDPGEHVFYAGGRDGKIYIAALSAESQPTKYYGMHIIGLLSDNREAITCLAYSTEGNLLLSGSENGIIKVWDPKTHRIVRTFKHSEGPVNNILVVSQALCRNPLTISSKEASSRSHQSLSLPSLSKYSNSSDEDTKNGAVVNLRSNCDVPMDAQYLSSQIIKDQIKELQLQGSAAATEMEVERLKQDCQRHMQMIQQWKKTYENLHEFCVNELLDGDQTKSSSGRIA